MTIALLHRDASSTLDSMWEYDDRARAVVLIIGGIALEVPVCTEAHPVLHAYSIARVSESHWRLAPSRYEKEGATWLAKSCPYPLSGVDVFIDLVCTPSRVAEQLAEL